MIHSIRRVLARAALSALLALSPALAVRADQSSTVTPQTGPHSMADFTTNFLNPALRALLSCSSGAAAPVNGPQGAPMAGQCWLDTSTTPLTLRYYDGGQWLAFATLDATGHVLALPNATLSGSVKIPGLTGYVYSPGSSALTASPAIPTTALTGPLQAAQVPAFTGDFSCSGLTCALAAANSTPGTFGGASSVPVLVLDGKGRVTGVTTVTVVAPAGTLTGGALPANVLNSSLQTLGSGAALGNLSANSVDATKMFQAPSLTLRGNMTGSAANVSDSTLTAILDAVYGSTQGQIICRGVSAWQTIAGGTSGYPLTGNGAGICPSYQPANAAASTPNVVNVVNLKIAPGGTPASQSTVTADSMTLKGGANGLVLQNVAVTCGTGATGANGLDAGTVAPNTWYAQSVISNGSTTACLLSTSATSPTLPSGYTYVARVGWQRTNASSQLQGVQQYGRSAQWIVDGTRLGGFPLVINNGGNGTTAQATVSNGFAPSTASAIRLTFNNTGSASSYCAPNANFSTGISATNPPPVGGTVTAAGHAGSGIMILESPNVYCSAGANGYVRSAGWEDNL